MFTINGGGNHTVLPYALTLDTAGNFSFEKEDDGIDIYIDEDWVVTIAIDDDLLEIETERGELKYNMTPELKDALKNWINELEEEAGWRDFVFAPPPSPIRRSRRKTMRKRKASRRWRYSRPTRLNRK